MVSHLLKYPVKDQAVQPVRPAKAFQPRQKAPRRDRLAAIVEQTRHDFVMQHHRGILSGHDRLEIQFKTALAQCLLQEDVPRVMILAHGQPFALFNADPTVLGMSIGLCQRLIG